MKSKTTQYLLNNTVSLELKFDCIRGPIHTTDIDMLSGIASTIVWMLNQFSE